MDNSLTKSKPLPLLPLLPQKTEDIYIYEHEHVLFIIISAEVLCGCLYYIAVTVVTVVTWCRCAHSNGISTCSRCSCRQSNSGNTSVTRLGDFRFGYYPPAARPSFGHPIVFLLRGALRRSLDWPKSAPAFAPLRSASGSDQNGAGRTRHGERRWTSNRRQRLSWGEGLA
jgi:hypothetical protein